MSYFFTDELARQRQAELLGAATSAAMLTMATRPDRRARPWTSAADRVRSLLGGLTSARRARQPAGTAPLACAAC